MAQGTTPESELDKVKTHLPTRKWWAMLVTSLAAFVINWIQAGTFNKEILIVLVGLVAQAVVTYLLPNSNTPGGVPTKDPNPTN